MPGRPCGTEGRIARKRVRVRLVDVTDASAVSAANDDAMVPICRRDLRELSC